MPVAPLDIQANSQSVAKAAIDLDLLAQKAVEAGVALSRLDDNTARVNQSQASVASSMRSTSSAAMQEVQSLGLAERGLISFGNTSKAVSASIQAQTEIMHNFRFSTANIAAQFQDIAVTSAMGMNAWTIGLQQGTQLSAALAGAGGGLKGLASSLAAGLASVVSPLSLVTIGVVTLASAAIQWGMQTFAATKDAKAGFEDLKKEVDGLLKGYEDAGKAADAAFARGLPQGVVESDLGASLTEQSKAAEKLKANLDGIVSTRDGMTDMADELDRIGESIGSFGGEGDIPLFGGDTKAQADFANYIGLVDQLAIGVNSSKEELVAAAVAARDLYNTTNDDGLKNAANDAYNLAIGLIRSGDAAYALKAALAELQNASELDYARGAAQDATNAIEAIQKKIEGMRTEREVLSDQLSTAQGGDAIQRLAAEKTYKEAIDKLDERDAERKAKKLANKESPEEKWGKTMSEYEDQLDMMEKENELYDASTFERARASAAQELLNKAEADGLAITPDVQDQIDTLADRYARLALEAEGVTTTLANRTVFEDLQEELRSLDEQLAAGVISWETYQRAVGGATASAAAQALGAIGNLASGLSAAFEDNKALSVATAVLKGAEAIASAYAEGNKYFGPAGGAAFAAVAAITAAANVAAVLSVDKNSKSIGSSAGGSTASTPTATPGAGLHVQLIGNANTPTTLGRVEDVLREIQDYLGTNGKQLAITYAGA